MAFDFPGPGGLTVGQQVTPPGGGTYQWDNVKWIAVPGSAVFAPVNSPVLTGDPQAPTAAAGDSDQSIATTSFVQAAVAPALNDAGRNLIHNGTFTVAQRGAGPWTVNGNTVDRWYMQSVTDTFSWTRVALSDADRAAIGDEAATYCIQNTFTGNAAAGAFTECEQRIEDIRRLANKTVTLSFWAKAASGTPKIGSNFYMGFGTGGSPSAGVEVLATGNSATLSTSWTRYNMTAAIPSSAGKTLGTNGDSFVAMQLWFSSGATNNAAAGNIGVQSGTIQLWGVQLEIGSVMTPLAKRDPADDPALCQRFYCTGNVCMYGTSSGVGNGFGVYAVFPVVMRGTPTIAFSGTSYIGAATIASAAPSPSNFRAIATANVASGGAAAFDTVYTASADL